MILILGRKDDHSTTIVAEWLYYFNKQFIIINTEDNNIKIIEYCPDKNIFCIKKNNQIYNLYDVTSVWNRRHGFSTNNFTNNYLEPNSQFFLEKGDSYHYKHMQEESKCLFDFIHYLLENNSIRKIGSFFYNDVNKLMVLDKAQKNGLMTPKTYILTRKIDLIRLLNAYPTHNFITKPLSQGVYRANLLNDYVYYNHVERITQKDVDRLSEEFYPSLFQIEENKLYEIRAFYLFGNFYSMAIFSQCNKETKVDFRKNKYWEHPLKTVPYSLPKSIENNITNLMNELKLETGSIDLIVNNDGDYIFLEVNPCGQFGMTSTPCNYYLEKKIAELLI